MAQLLQLFQLPTTAAKCSYHVRLHLCLFLQAISHMCSMEARFSVCMAQNAQAAPALDYIGRQVHRRQGHMEINSPAHSPADGRDEDGPEGTTADMVSEGSTAPEGGPRMGPPPPLPVTALQGWSHLISKAVANALASEGL